MSLGATPTREQHIRLLTGFTDYYVAHGQTDPPTKPVSELFSKGSFPAGEILPHGKTKYPNPLSSYARQTEAERRYFYFKFYFIVTGLGITFHTIPIHHLLQPTPGRRTAY